MQEWILKTYPAMRHKAFRLYFYASMIGMLGLWVNITGQQWLVYTLTKSPLKLGLLGAAQFLPTLLLSLHAGVVIDRSDKRKLVMCTQAASMCIAWVLAYLVWSGHVMYWQVLVLAVISGFVVTFDLPARQALLAELVGDDKIQNAVNLISVTINLARFLGPAIGAYLINQYNIAVCFTFDGLVYVPVIFMLSMISIAPMEKVVEESKDMLKEIRAGLSYAKGNFAILFSLVVIGIVSVVLWNYSVTMPIFAADILHGAVTDFGILSASLGAGSLVGAFCASTFLQKRPSLKMIGIFAALFHISYGLTAFSTKTTPATIGFFIMGIFSILFLNTANALIQLEADSEFRGRVMSLFTLVFFGVTPVGNISVGWFLDYVPAYMGVRLLPVISAFLIVVALYVFKYRKIA